MCVEGIQVKERGVLLTHAEGKELNALDVIGAKNIEYLHCGVYIWFNISS